MFFVIIAVFAVDYIGPPFLVVKIPLDRLVNSVREFSLREPTKLTVDLGGVDSVAHIVSLSVGNVGDKALGLAELFADELNDVDICHFVMTADVIHLAYPSLMDNEIYRLAVILNVEPISYVLALSVHGKRLVVKRVRDHKRNELFGEMIRSVVIRATADRHGQTEGAVIRKH